MFPAFSSNCISKSKHNKNAAGYEIGRVDWTSVDEPIQEQHFFILKNCQIVYLVENSGEVRRIMSVCACCVIIPFYSER